MIELTLKLIGITLLIVVGFCSVAGTLLYLFGGRK